MCFQRCIATARAQVALLSELRAADGEDEDARQQVEEQWSAAAEDAAAAARRTETRLQLVTDYCRQTGAAEAALQRLTAELEAVTR